MLYEFTLAQLISLFFGSTFEIYAITVGLYTFSLGLGALYYEKKLKGKQRDSLLLKVEVFLSITALLSPFLIVYLSSTKSLISIGWLAKTISFAPVFLCGWLSGIELPCLLNFSKEKSEEDVLFVDFFGMFVGAILFSLVLIDSLGPLKLIWTLCLLNIVTIFTFLYFNRSKVSKEFLLSGAISFCLISFCLVNELSIIKFFRDLHSV
jgi:predicted membrane-bound spermidine synthase